MRLGMLVRGEDRGLGVLTREAYRHLQPERTLLVHMGALARGFACHADWYPDATSVDFEAGHFDEPTVRRWLRGLDVVYTAETPYDWRLFAWAREEGVRTVLHVMPEFHRTPDMGHAPDVWWAPTRWRLDLLPEGTTLVPVPVATERLPARPRDERTFLHLVGHKAAADRAGTNVLLRALRSVRHPLAVTLVTQDPDLALPRSLPSHVELRLRTRSGGDYWANYEDPSVLVAPRRYGGLSLPLNEAAGAGLGLVMPDSSPHREWPGVFVSARQRGQLTTAAGQIPVMEVSPQGLAVALDGLTTIKVREISGWSLAWAEQHSWERLRPLYDVEMEKACQCG